MMLDEECDFKSLIDIFDPEDPLMSSDLSLGNMDFASQNEKDQYHTNKRRRSRYSGVFGNGIDSNYHLTNRLRRVAEVHKNGVITDVEKNVIKDRLLTKDARFANEFDQAIETGNWDRVRQLLHKGRSTSFGARRGNMMMMPMMDGEQEQDRNTRENLLTEDLSAVFDLSTALDQKQPMKKPTSAPVQANTTKSKKATTTKKPKTPRTPKTKAIASSQKPSKLLTHSPVVKSKAKSMQRPTPPNSDKQVKKTTSAVNKTNTPPKTQPSVQKSSQKKEQSSSGIKAEEANIVRKINKHFNKGRRSEVYPVGENDKDAKFRKNERERRRRLMVSQGFSDLVTVLKLPETAKVDKATVLNNSIKKIQTLQKRVAELELENKKLREVKV